MLKHCIFNCRTFSSVSALQHKLIVNDVEYDRDSFTNVTPKILSHLNKGLHIKEFHPLSFLRERIVNYFYNTFKGRTGTPTFSVYDNLIPVVSTDSNFDSLLVPKDHVSRNKTDCYYLNKNYMLRSHMTAYQSEYLRMGLNHFILIGDVYRRDEIDSTHYPVFHQIDTVSISTPGEVFLEDDDGKIILDIFEKDPKKQVETSEKQSVYSLDASKRIEFNLKQTLENLTKDLFGKNIKYKWTDSYFPFTHPSWELEILLDEKWLEVLGCGIMRYDILKASGCENHIGWAFGLGLERLAMLLYQIPDIRLFWSIDPGFHCQFQNKTCYDTIAYKPVSQYPPLINDISFWIPNTKQYSSNDFYELARDIGGDKIEQIKLVDEFKKNELLSHCYRITYRSMEKTLTQSEVTNIHKLIEQKAAEVLEVKIR